MQGNFISAIVRDALKTELDELSDKKELNDLTIYHLSKRRQGTHRNTPIFDFLVIAKNVSPCFARNKM